MFSSRSPSSGLDAILSRRRPGKWNLFLQNPVVFVARRLYSWRLTDVNLDSPKSSVTHAISVICISDTHTTQPDLPDGDVLIHAGDLTHCGSFAEIQTALDWINGQPHRHKIVIAGNHDLLLDEGCDGQIYTADSAAAVERDNLNWGSIIYLQNSSTTINCANGRQLKVYGSPMTPKHGNWAFQYPRTEDVWTNTVSDDTDVLVTHGPPRAHLDLLNFGCEYLLRELWRVRPRLHVFGHVHGGCGVERVRFDWLQEAYERAVVAKGGVWNLVRVVKAFLWGFVGSRASAGTTLVNAAMVGGLRDTERGRAVKVYV